MLSMGFAYRSRYLTPYRVRNTSAVTIWLMESFNHTRRVLAENVFPSKWKMFGPTLVGALCYKKVARPYRFRVANTYRLRYIDSIDTATDGAMDGSPNRRGAEGPTEHPAQP